MRKEGKVPLDLIIQRTVLEVWGFLLCPFYCFVCLFWLVGLGFVCLFLCNNQSFAIFLFCFGFFLFVFLKVESTYYLSLSLHSAV